MEGLILNVTQHCQILKPYLLSFSLDFKFLYSEIGEKSDLNYQIFEILNYYFCIPTLQYICGFSGPGHSLDFGNSVVVILHTIITSLINIESNFQAILTSR